MLSMTSRTSSWGQFLRSLMAVACAVLLLPGEGLLLAQGTAPAPTPSPAPAAAAEPEATKLPPDQLDSLVAPIALYPDPLLAQTLVASTYPLEIIQLQQWLAKNPTLKDKALADAVAKQPWDPAIQSMAALPDVVKRLSDDIQWTTDLGNAFLEQQNDVMDAVQRMRKVAKDKGALVSNEQMKVETQVVEQKTVIVVQPSNPEVIYVPSYSPAVVYGPPVYPYPPIYYPPPPPPGAYFMSFAVGVAWGAAIWGGSCCGCGWGHSNSNVNINVNNNFNRNTNINGGNRPGGGGNNNWNHNPQHRGAAPYSNKSTANKYGGSAKGQSPSARQQPAGGSRGPSAGQQPGGGSRGPSAGQQPAGGSRGGAPSAGASNRGGSGGADRIGNQSIPKSSASRSGGGGFGGSSGYSGASARASSSRGASSMGSRGGGSRGGGGRGGGGRR